MNFIKIDLNEKFAGPRLVDFSGGKRVFFLTYISKFRRINGKISLLKLYGTGTKNVCDRYATW